MNPPIHNAVKPLKVKPLKYKSSPSTAFTNAFDMSAAESVEETLHLGISAVLRSHGTKPNQITGPCNRMFVFLLLATACGPVLLEIPRGRPTNHVARLQTLWKASLFWWRARTTFVISGKLTAFSIRPCWALESFAVKRNVRSNTGVSCHPFACDSALCLG